MLWPIVLTGACEEIKKTKITRIHNTGKRRLSLEKKVGPGLSIGEYRKSGGRSKSEIGAGRKL